VARQQPDDYMPCFQSRRCDTARRRRKKQQQQQQQQQQY
jgi:hypothetical protein